MLTEAGHFALALALGLSLVQLAVPLWGTRANDPVLTAGGLAGRVVDTTSGTARVALITDSSSNVSAEVVPGGPHERPWLGSTLPKRIERVLSPPQPSLTSFSVGSCGCRSAYSWSE